MITQSQFEQVPRRIVLTPSIPVVIPPVTAAPAHVHQWENRPLQSDDEVTRYQCTTCQRWGRRVWPRIGRHVPAIRAYRSSRTEPKAEWSWEPWPQDVTEENDTVSAHHEEMDDSYREGFAIGDERWSE